jgi:long-chain acyl-CoA synthetase
LNRQVEELAHILRKHGLGKNQTIGLLVSNSDSAVIGLFAVLRIGACAVSLNPLLHPKEVVSLSKSTDVAGIFVTRRQYDLLVAESLDSYVPTLKKIVIVPEEAFSLQEIEIKDASIAQPCLDQPQTPTNGLSDEDNALIVYTSGTTGSAKAVVLTHKNLLEKSKAAVAIMNIVGSDRALMTLLMCHVFSLTRQLFPHFLQGAVVHIISSSAPADLLNYIIDTQGITTFSGVPYHFSAMLARGAGKKYPMRTLRLATSSSMRMRPALREELVQALPHTSFSSQYGLTETSGFVTALLSELFARKLDSVGRCIPGVDIKIADFDAHRSLSANAESVGELLVRGSGIMKCYYKNPEATAAVIDSHGWLRTGDLARIDPNGDVTIISRKKHLIKRAGEFIIPEEVEAIIARHDAVDEVCVFGIPDKDLGESVRAAVVLHDERACKEDILNHCRENLAEFKIPEDIFFVDALEKTHIGKVNQKAILKRYLASHEIVKRLGGASPTLLLNSEF